MPSFLQGADRLKAELRTAWRVVQEGSTVADVLRLFDPVAEDRPLWDTPRGGGRGGGRGGQRRGGGSGGTPVNRRN